MITCFIRYEIDPFKIAAFDEYARAGARPFPAAAPISIGYFAPHEGSATTAYGIYNVESLAAYEHYRERLKADPQGRGQLRIRQARKLHPARGPDLSPPRLGAACGALKPMIAVIFEVWPAEGRTQHYLDLAAALRADLERSTDSFPSSASRASASPANSCPCRSFATRRRCAMAQPACHRRTQAGGPGAAFSAIIACGSRRCFAITGSTAPEAPLGQPGGAFAGFRPEPVELF